MSEEVYIFPLSFSQQRLWFLDQLLPHSPAYNIPLAVRMAGFLHVPVLEKSLQTVVERHEALRTTFQVLDEEPVQVVHPSRRVTLNVIDLQSVPAARRENQARQLALAEAHLPFDLAKGPLLRAALLRLAPTEHIILLTMHHIISDAWSRGILTRELLTLYDAFLNGQANPLPDLPIQYADFTLWQNEQLQGAKLARLVNYWRRQLEGIPARLALPTRQQNPVTSRDQGARETLTLSPELTQALKIIGQRQEATLFMTLLAAFAILLQRISGQDDIVMGTPIANRNQADIENLIGFFINTLVLRVRFQPNQSFMDLLAQVQETAIGAYAHQDLPFEKLVETLQPERHLGQNPLFQVMFALQNMSTPTKSLPNLVVEPLSMSETVVRFDLTLTLYETARGLEAVFEYKRDLFDQATMIQLLQYLRSILQAITAEPDRPLTTLSLWSSAKLPHDEQLPVTPTTSFVTLFEQQVRQTHQAIALVAGPHHLTYDQLNRRANQLARHLQAAGVEPEAVVGVCLERSSQAIIALLAVLKAGGVYLPLDPTYPPERLAFMLQDSQARFLIGQDITADRCQRIDLDTFEPGRYPPENLTQSYPDGRLAYLIYTSGSTGTPKGVMVSHQALIGHCLTVQKHYELSANDRVLQFTSLSFDASLEQILPPLISGATVVLQTHLEDALAFNQTMTQQRLTVLNLPPSYWQQLRDEITMDYLPRLIILGGEALPADDVWPGETPGTTWLNAYGPTETIITALTYRLPAAAEALSAIVPIGKPLSGRIVYILDKFGVPVPPGVTGELAIGGHHLARGYINRPGQTAVSFVPDPFSPQPGARLYKTGDLARYGPDGAIEFMGRRDNQVKVRGFRVELGEIEAILRRHPSVHDSVVVLAPRSQQLVAHLVTRQEDEKQLENELKTAVAAALPTYMHPVSYLFLELFPRLPNGKIDRQTLAASEVATPDRKEHYEPPQTPRQEILAGIWRETLQIDQIGLNDNFFELGGHSLLATQVVSHIRHHLQVDVPLRRIFETPTLGGLAEALDQMADIPQPPPIRPRPRQQAPPLSFAQERLWFLDQLEPGNPAYNLPWSMRLSGPLHIAAFDQSLQTMVARHEALRTCFVVAGGQPVQHISDPQPLVWTFVDLTGLPPRQQTSQLPSLINEGVWRPFNLSQSPLFRVTLLRLAAEDHILLLNMHHIIADGWSLSVFIREMVTCYEAYRTKRPLTLPPLPIQYADFAHWQRAWLQGAIYDQLVRYWRQQLANLPPLLPLPTDYPRPASNTFRGSNQRFHLIPALTRQLKQLGQAQGVTLFMILLAALQTLLYRYTGQPDICVGTFIANRNRIETENLIGFFLNNLALRTNLSGNPTFIQLLDRVREVTLGAYAHQDLPFEKLLDALEIERSLKHTPLFQVALVLQNVPQPETTLAELSVSSLPFVKERADFDLTLWFSEMDEQLVGVLDYNSDLFQDETITRLLRHLQQVLEAVVQSPNLPILDLPLLSEPERQQLLADWNPPHREPVFHCIHHQFEAQAARSPGAIAIQSEAGSLTYAQLNRRANRLAHHLIASGVGPETLVGICLNRSPEVIIAMMAILKAGGAYMPLDPASPPQRLATLTSEARLTLLVTHSAFVPLLEKESAQPITYICLDQKWQMVSEYPSTEPSVPVTGTNLAYLISTSGSTGRPKGVVVPHRALANFVDGALKAYDMQPSDRVLQFAALVWDTSIEEIFPTLCCGATLVLRSQTMLDSAEHFVQICNRWRLTILNLPTAYWHLLMTGAASTNPSALPSSLRLLIIGGERALPQHLATWQARMDPAIQLVNTYGLTEATAVSTLVNLTALSQPAKKMLEAPIGRPLQNVQAYILDSRLNPVPVGVFGELYIGGAGLARGYYRQPGETAARFVPNPFGQLAGARLYRTGDQARYLANGQIEFRGRIDQQIKIRGFRIEPGEVEAAISTHPAVERAFVAAHEPRPGDMSLVAYITLKDGKAPDNNQWRHFLGAILPDYMIPILWVTLAAFPLTPSGKIDRQKLPEPDVNRPLTTQFVPPETVEEQLLAQIYSELLSVAEIGRYDNFFELGGHSLLATQLVSRIRQIFEIELPLRLVFESPAVAELALRIEEQIIEQLEQEAVDDSYTITDPNL